MGEAYVEVELWNAEPDGVEATRKTFSFQPPFPPDAFKEEGGRFYVKSGFTAFAAESQGYVKRVIK